MTTNYILGLFHLKTTGVGWQKSLIMGEEAPEKGITSQPLESYFSHAGCTFQYTKYQSDEKGSIRIFIVICSHPINVHVVFSMCLLS